MNSNKSPILELSQALHGHKGMAFGLRAPTAVTALRYSGPPPENLSNLDRMMAEFIGESDSPPAFSEADPIVALIERLCHWQAVLQRQSKIPLAQAFYLRDLKDDGTPEKLSQNYRLAIAYIDLKATERTLNWLLDAVNHWLQSPPDARKVGVNAEQTNQELQTFLRRHGMGGTNLVHFLDAAHALKIPLTHMVDDVYCFGHGKHSKLLMGSLTENAGSIGVGLARNKFNCTKVLRKFGIPVAKHALANTESRAVEIARELGYPVVVKPADLDQGKGVFAGLKNDNAVRTAFKEAKEFSKRILVEKHHHGEDYRLTVMHNKVIKIMHRRAGGVHGDGHSSIQELVAQMQKTASSLKVLRRTGKHRLLLDSEALDLLAEEGYTPESIISEGQFLPLRRKANISAGGEYRVMPSSAAHPDNLELAVWATQVLRLDIAGIDLIIPDVAVSWRDSGAIICEVNAQPQIGIKDTPEVYQQILSELLPDKGTLLIQLWIFEHAIQESAIPSLLNRSSKLAMHALSANGRNWIDGAMTTAAYPNNFVAAQALLCDQRVHSAAVVMTADEIRRFGLPAAQFDSIQLLTEKSSDEVLSRQRPLLRMLNNHSEKVQIVKVK